jgi:YhcN/YlaJ family sporulation lipoprotein
MDSYGMKRKIFVLVMIILMVISILSISACSAQNRPGPVEPTPTPNTTPDPSQADEDVTMSNKLADRISTMEEINSATVVVSGSKAWVGVDLQADAGTEVTEEVKTKITQMVKNQANNIRTVYVTADADTVTRLRNVARDITAGKPISGFMDELIDITKRIMPSAQ